MKYYLFTVVHDYEGDFGQLADFDTLEDAMKAAEEFEEANSDQYRMEMGWAWSIIKGQAVLKGDTNGRRLRSRA